MFLIYLLCFFFYKSENRRSEQILLGAGVMVGISGSAVERGRRMNVEQAMYTRVCKCKNDTC
jgi:hypothetical protein